MGQVLAPQRWMYRTDEEYEAAWRAFERHARFMHRILGVLMFVGPLTIFLMLLLVVRR